jgi:hypothetical protein
MTATTELMTVQARTIFCTCGGFLEGGTYPLGLRARRRLRLCSRCHHEERPSWPVLLVGEHGHYVVELHAGRVTLEGLGPVAWPDGGWS